MEEEEVIHKLTIPLFHFSSFFSIFFICRNITYLEEMMKLPIHHVISTNDTTVSVLLSFHVYTLLLSLAPLCFPTSPSFPPSLHISLHLLSFLPIFNYLSGCRGVLVKPLTSRHDDS